MNQRLRRVEARDWGRATEDVVFNEVLARVLRSPRFRDLKPAMSDSALLDELERSKEETLEPIARERSDLHKAVRTDFEARRGMRRALRPIVFFALPAALAAAVAFVVNYVVLPSTAPVLFALVGVSSTLLALYFFLESGLLAAIEARSRARRDLVAAERLFRRALLEIAFPDRLRAIRAEQSEDELPPAPSPSGPSVAVGAGVLLGSLNPENLVETYDREQQVETETRNRLRKLVSGLSAGSIGIAGVRGVGKTSLLRWLIYSQQKDHDHLGLRIAAPVRYEPRDFVLTLFAALCEEVQEAHPVQPLPARRRLLGSRAANYVAIALVLAGVAIYAVGESVSPSPAEMIGTAFVLAGGLLVIAHLLAASGESAIPSDYLSDKTIEDTENPAEIAGQLLLDIHFQLTFASGYSGKLTTGVGELGADMSYSLATRQESFPRVIARFQAFAKSVARRHGKLYVAIDEIDKLSVEDAVRFLDDLKGLFGVPGCFFLVSISEDALGEFERRGFPLRTAFDSAFDEVVPVEPLHVDESVAMLGKRVDDLPTNLARLCHVLAGGIPRDVIRQARRLVLMTDRGTTMASAARMLVAEELKERARGLKLARDESGVPAQGLPAGWRFEPPRADIPSLLDAARHSTGSAVPMGCMAFLAATVLQLIEADTATFSALRQEAATLGKARLEVIEAPDVAWQRCNQARENHGIETFERADGGLLDEDVPTI